MDGSRRWLKEDWESVSRTLKGLQRPYLKHQIADRSQSVCEVTIYSQLLSWAYSYLSVSFLRNGYFANIRRDFEARFRHQYPWAYKKFSCRRATVLFLRLTFSFHQMAPCLRFPTS